MDERPGRPPGGSPGAGEYQTRHGTPLQVEYADKIGNISSVNGKTASVNKDGLSCRKTTGGAVLTFSFPKEGFVIPLEFTLTEDALDVAILAGEIQETNDAYRLTTLSLLPYFGAAGSEEDGYLFVPDGSGALIEWNKTGGVLDDYSQYVYGREPATSKMQLDKLEETAYLPVFGLKKGETAFVGIITQGAGRAIVNASVSGKRCSYSNVYVQFIYRDSEMVKIEQKNQTVRVLEKTPAAAERYGVRYAFLSGEEANYTGHGPPIRKLAHAGFPLQKGGRRRPAVHGTARRRHGAAECPRVSHRACSAADLLPGCRSHHRADAGARGGRPDGPLPVLE